MNSSETNQGSDRASQVVFICEGRRFVVPQSSIASLGSKYGKLIKEAEANKEIILQDVNCDVFEVVLKLIDRNEEAYNLNTLDAEILLPLYEHCVRMELNDLVKLSRARLETVNLTDSTALLLRELAIREDDSILHTRALEFLVYRWKYLFHCEKLLNISLKEFQCIINIALEKEAHTHFFILIRILDWIQHDFPNRIAYIKQLISNINFQNIPLYYSNHLYRTEDPMKLYLQPYIKMKQGNEDSNDFDFSNIAVIISTGQSELHISEEGGKLLPLSKTPFKIKEISVLLTLDRHLVILQEKIQKGENNTLLKFDFLTSLWMAFPIPFALRQMQATKVDNFIYVLGKAEYGYDLVCFNHLQNKWENNVTAKLRSDSLDCEQHFLLALNDTVYVVIDREKLPRTEPAQGLVICFRFDRESNNFKEVASEQREGYGCDEAFIFGEVIVLRRAGGWLQFDPTAIGGERLSPIQLDLPNHASRLCSISGKKMVFAVQDGEKKLFLTVHDPLQSKQKKLAEIKKGKKCTPHIIAFDLSKL